MRGSFPGEELNLSLAGPGLLSVAWWKQHGGAGRAERLCAPVQQGPTNQAVPALKDVFGLWSVPGVPRWPLPALPWDTSHCPSGTCSPPARSPCGFGRRGVGSTAILLVHSESGDTKKLGLMCSVLWQCPAYPMCSACCGHLAAAPRGVGGTVLRAEEGKQECRRILFSPKLAPELAGRISF